QARATLRRRALLPAPPEPGEPREQDAAERPPRRWPSRRRSGETSPALEMRGVWHELRDGPAVLRGVDLSLRPGATPALTGRSGAAKSTSRRHAGALLDPTRGTVRSSGRVALLLQNPNDYLLHERVADEAAPEALELLGLAALAARHPRDLSGGERQRLAL